MKNHKLYSISLFLVVVFIFSLQKESDREGKIKAKCISLHLLSTKSPIQTNAYSSDVVLQWMDMQLELIRTSSPFIGGLPPSRPFAYTGIALYEAVVPGMPAYRSLSEQLTDMPAMPQTVPGSAYHWPTCANAALAAMNRNFFPNASDANKAAINALEEKLNAIYKTEVGNEVFQRSAKFGQEVAQLIFDWSKTDGYTNANEAIHTTSWPRTLGTYASCFCAGFRTLLGKQSLIRCRQFRWHCPYRLRRHILQILLPIITRW